jgi:hypothetical protein
MFLQRVFTSIDESNCAQNEDSSAVVSSTQDVEKVAGRYHQMPGIQVISRQMGGYKLVARQLGGYIRQFSGFESRNLSKIQNGPHKETLANTH